MFGSRVSLISVLLFGVVGCASDVSSELRRGGVESKELYKKRQVQNDRSRVEVGNDRRRARYTITQNPRYEPYTRSALNETEQLFDLLPNPKISIHVYPHISTRDNAPVPGYTTAVSLYKSDEYGLPSEILAQGEVVIESESSGVAPEGNSPGSVLPPAGRENSLEVNLIRERNKVFARGKGS